jgi:hypothetical protein
VRKFTLFCCIPHAARGRPLHVELLIRLLSCLYDRLAESALADPVDADNLRIVGARRERRESESARARRREKEHRERAGSKEEKRCR